MRILLAAALAVPWLMLMAPRGCPPLPSVDTCNDGVNMSNPRLDGGWRGTGDALSLRIVWDLGTGVGAELPAGYFDEAAVAGETDEEVAALIEDAPHTGDNELTVHFGPAAGEYVVGLDELAFTLEFPDRDEYTDCTHPAMDDRYLLHVALILDAEGAIVDSTLTEEVNLGDY